jgi:hypothetical protein
MQQEVIEFVAWVRQELGRAAQDGWQERLQQALVRLPPTPLARAAAKDASTKEGAKEASAREDAGARAFGSGRAD